MEQFHLKEPAVKWVVPQDHLLGCQGLGRALVQNSAWSLGWRLVWVPQGLQSVYLVSEENQLAIEQTLSDSLVGQWGSLG